MAKGLDVSITGWLNTEVPEVKKRALIQLVRENKQRVISEQTARSGGIAPDLESMIVDGRRGASEADIQASTMRVILDWNYITEAVIKTVGYLQLHGPELTGAWKQSIVTLINGQQQSVDQHIPSDTAEATVAVTVPYARKLEVGRTEAGRAFSIQVPQHLVESAAIKLRAELRELAEISFGYVDLAGAHQLTEKGQHRRDFRSGRAKQAAKRHGETTTRAPAITIREIKAI